MLVSLSLYVSCAPSTLEDIAETQLLSIFFTFTMVYSMSTWEWLLGRGSRFLVLAGDS